MRKSETSQLCLHTFILGLLSSKHTLESSNKSARSVLSKKETGSIRFRGLFLEAPGYYRARLVIPSYVKWGMTPFRCYGN